MLLGFSLDAVCALAWFSFQLLVPVPGATSSSPSASIASGNRAKETTEEVEHEEEGDKPFRIGNILVSGGLVKGTSWLVGDWLKEQVG